MMSCKKATSCRRLLARGHALALCRVCVWQALVLDSGGDFSRDVRALVSGVPVRPLSGGELELLRAVDAFLLGPLKRARARVRKRS